MHAMAPIQPDAIAGVLCALPEELGGLAERSSVGRDRNGLRLHELDLVGRRVLACVGGVGKVAAAHAAATLASEGIGALFVVGVCGALVRGLGPGNLVHCSAALQADLGLAGRGRVESDPDLRRAWTRCAPGRSGIFITRDRAAVMPWRRVWLARRLGGVAVDMETAAAGAVAAACGIPWAALRAVTDGLWSGGALAFREHFPAQAGRAADTLLDLLALDLFHESPLR